MLSFSDHLSTGFWGLDALLEGLRPGDNIVFHAPSEKFFRPFVQALITHGQHEHIRLSHIRIDPTLDDLLDSLPAAARFDILAFTGPMGTLDDPQSLIEAIRSFILRQGQEVYYVSPNLTTLAVLLGRESVLRTFYEEICTFLADLQTIAYWFIVEDSLTPETIAAIRDTAQIFLEVTGAADSPIIHVGKALGRYSDHMAWPHRVNLQTGQVHPLHEAPPSKAHLTTYLQGKALELRDVRDQYARALLEEKIVTEFCHSELTHVPLPALLEFAVAHVSRLLDFPVVFFMELHGNSGTAHVSHGVEWQARVMETTFPFPSYQSPEWRAWFSKPFLFTENLGTHPIYRHLPFLRDPRSHSGVFLPVQGLHGPFGLLGACAQNPHRLKEHDVAFLHTVTNLLALAVQRRQHQQEKEASQVHLEGIIKISQDAIISIDEDQRIFLFNPAAEETFGYKAEEVLGRSVELLIPSRFGENHPHHIRAFGKSSEQLRPIKQHGRITGLKKNGSEFPAEAAIAKFEIENRRTFTVRLRDLTVQLQTEEALRQSEAQLRHVQKLDAIGTLAGGIAHDFNNILTAMLGYTALASQASFVDQRILGYLEQVATAGHRAKDLVSQILTFSRQTEGERKIFCPHLIVNEVIELLRATLPSTMTIRPQFKEGFDKTILGDPTQIHQVVMNLCTNAAHAMRDKGGILEICLTTVYAHLDESSLPSAQLGPGDYLTLQVRDTGHGMTPEILERMFEPFFTTKLLGEGFGMGLSVVHGIIANHGGTITVDSQVEHGTTVTVYLPCLDVSIQNQDVQKPIESDRQSRGRILFVEDEVMLAQMVQELLTGYGFDIVAYTNSLEALEMFRSAPSDFDLVITDQTMPLMDGEKFARELLHIRPDTPIILCTGFSHTMTKEKAMALGIKAFVMKPWSSDDLIATIQRVLNQSGKNSIGKRV